MRFGCGHEKTPANTYVYPHAGWKSCKTCSLAHTRKHDLASLDVSPQTSRMRHWWA